VTSGSRIKRDNFSTPSPVQIIRNEDATLAGFTSTAQVLQSTGVTSGQGQINNAYGGFVTDGGPGANTIGLRGFAPTRSLVLLNGRRLSPSGTRGSVGAADLNTLPNSIVDRIEVLKDGASSIYGSDAVAGVINIITKKNLNSITLDASVSRTEHGGANGSNFAISGGRVGDDTRFLASYQFNELTAMTLGQRDWTRCNTDYRRTSANGVVGEWGSRDFVDPLTGQPKCYPISGTGSNGVTINTIGTNTIAGVGAAGFGGWQLQPLAPQLGREHRSGRFRGRGRWCQQPQRARHLRPARARQHPDLAGPQPQRLRAGRHRPAHAG
jgi:iron complex outermembrane receptor protein